MLTIRRLGLLLLLGALPLLAQAQWFSSSDQNDDFLPVLEAFQPTAWHDGDTLFVGVEAADEYYLYRHQFAVDSLNNGVRLGEPELPEGTYTNDEFLGDVYIFRNRVVMEVPLENDVSGPLDIDFTFQGCADAGLCYPPETLALQATESQPPPAFADWAPATSDEDEEAPAASPEETSDEATSTAETTDTSAEIDDSAAPLGAPQSEDSRFSQLMTDASLPLALGLFFLAGIGLTFTPCVLPMVPILSSIIVGQQPTRPRAFLLSASYVLGMAVTYAAVGVLMGLFGAGLNLQAQLQSAPVLITFAVLFCVFGLAMLGAFDLRLSPRVAQRVDAWQARAQRSGLPGLALAGALSVLVVSPCVTAPLAGALVIISTTGDALTGGAMLFALGMGMGVPLLLVGTFGATLLPRSGAWLNGVKIAFGLLLFGVAIWMVERLVPGPVALLLWAALAIGTALALGAVQTNTPSGWPKARQTLGLVLLTWGIALTIGAAQGSNDPLRPLQPSGSASGAATAPLAFQRLDSMSGLDSALADAETADRPVFVHFTADWCISCRLLEREVYTDPDVIDELAGFERIAVDVTDTNAQSRALLNRFQLFGPPSLLFFHAGQEIREARIQGDINAADFTRHLRKLAQWVDSR
ncbi:protein-disulfide reductase DsbD [Halomonas sp. CUBES01]|uniref:protein-disulfide reductase DsbD n=1 Tax=Halomonas sp. CUBES01 TaxID=2897340 RepID=UPI001E458031|nr:protein-disulfide reductase DsbD [Halomonas sp. CUBES01]MEC4767224.1 protein-disulfide reductase DsbD [Halomonas sp. CUBES01]